MTPPAALAFRTVAVAGAREWLWGRPRDGTPPLLILQPLFAEMNRCRALVADLMAGLSARGLSPWALDLPGTGESERPLETVGWANWEAAVEAAVGALAPIATIALRGGALLEPELDRRWRFAPVTGEAVLRTLVRTRLASEAEPATDTATLTARLATGTVDLAGYRIAPALSQPLKTRVPPTVANARVITLADSAAAGDRAVKGPAPWRRAEPGRAPELAATLADDIADWLA